MKTNLKERVEIREGLRPAGAEQRLKERGIKLPAPPEPFGTYVEAVSRWRDKGAAGGVRSPRQ